jgi:hypothetical protein
MKPDDRQRKVGAGLLAATLFSAAVLAAGFYLRPIPTEALTGFPERLAFVLRADLFVFVWLLAAVGNVARARFFSPMDIDGSGLSKSSPTVSVKIAILQNTLEQVVLAVGAHVGLAAAADARTMALVPPLVILFCIGRAAFWLGYAGGATRRAFGFATTFYPTIFAYALALVFVAG